MTTFSLRQAAQEAGTSKSTILRAIQSGRLSATRTDDGGYSIDPAELFRVYPPKSVASDPEADRSAGQNPIALAPINSTEMLVRRLNWKPQSAACRPSLIRSGSAVRSCARNGIDGRHKPNASPSRSLRTAADSSDGSRGHSRNRAPLENCSDTSRGSGIGPEQWPDVERGWRPSPR